MKDFPQIDEYQGGYIITNLMHHSPTYKTRQEAEKMLAANEAYRKIATPLEFLTNPLIAWIDN